MKQPKFFMRRVHLLRRLPETGFVIFNPNAERDGLRFYSKTSTTRTSRTVYWCETADQAKIFDKEVSAKAVLRKMQKRNEKYKDSIVVSVESQMLDAFEIDTDSGEVRECKAWPVELENKAVFKTKIDAINSELEHKRKEKASYVLHIQTTQKEIENLEKAIENEIKNQHHRSKLPNALQAKHPRKN